jgi:ribosomal protein S1
MNQLNDRYTIGQRVAGAVERFLPLGICISLDDGTRGFICLRELSWLSDADPQELVQEGQRIEAIVLKLPDDARLLQLSRRATMPAP